MNNEGLKQQNEKIMFIYYPLYINKGIDGCQLCF